MAMQRLFRKQLHRRRQWDRLLDVVHQVVGATRAARGTFSRWEASFADASKAAAVRAQTSARK
jgi:hypothetical protein